MAAAAPKLEKPNVVLVHGGFGRIRLGGGLQDRTGAGCTVAVALNLTISSRTTSR